MRGRSPGGEPEGFGAVSLGEQAANLFRYLENLQRLQQATVRRSSRYAARGGLVEYLGKLPDSGAVRVAVPDESSNPSGPILTVDRIVAEDPPALPPVLLGHVTGDIANATRPPTLGSDVTGPFMGAEQREAITVAFEQWFQEWGDWADLERSRELYANLFAIRDQLAVAPQDWELLLGLGRLEMPSVNDPVDRHLVVLPLQIDLNGSSGEVAVRLADGAEARAEFDMLTAEELVSQAACRELEDDVAMLPTAHPLLVAQWRPALQRFVNFAMPEGEYVDAPQSAASRPRLSLSPAIVMRPRNRSGLLRALNLIATDLESLDEIPDGIRALVDPDSVSAAPPIDTPSAGGAAYERDGEFYLPLPVNPEQLQVLGRADSRPLTVVQGPPGTGKTHTTAVLISHFLTQGKRVLVTAQTQQALREVRDKLPDEIKQLAVSVLGNDRLEMSNLRASINAISQQAQAFSPVENDSVIDLAEKEIDALSRRRAELRNELIQQGALESAPRDTPYGRERLAEVARRILREQHDMPWATDLLPEATLDGDPPDSELVAEYRDLTIRWNRSEVVDEVKALPEGDVALHEVSVILALLDDFEDAQRACQGDAHRPPAPQIVRALHAEDDIEAIRQSVQTLLRARTSLRARREPWVASAVSDLQDGKTQQWLSRREQVRGLLGEASALVGPATAQGPIVVSKTSVEMRPLIASLLEFTQLHDIKVDAAGQPKTGMMAPRQVKAAKPLFDAVRVAGRPPTSHADFEALAAHNQLLDLMAALDASWPSGTPVSTEESAAERLAWHQDELGVLDAVLDLIDRADEAQTLAAGAGLGTIDTSNDDSLKVLVEQLDVVSRKLQAQDLEGQLRNLSASVLDSAGGAPCLLALAQAIRDRDGQRVIEAHRFARHVIDEAQSNRRRIALRAEIGGAHPRLIEALDADPLDLAWSVRIGHLSDGWSVSAARNWVDARAKFDPNQAQDEIVQIDARIRQHVAELVGRKAWAKAVSRLTPGRKADLQYYAQLVKSYGKGSGKRAGQLQVEIRKALANCRDAVPVWIMPLHQVADSQEIAMNAFDVVVVDEASQAGLESLFLQYLAPKLVIVGDDKQVSPSAVGVQVDEVAALANRFLAGNRYKAAFADPGRSLFDEAKMRYPDVITLREHRRCVPDIIGFSNDIAYAPEGVPLIPVREPGASALDPIVTRFCADGYLEGTPANARNPVEAQQIVTAIQEMIEDPQYRDKTIGVISLLGSYQAKLIERKLIASIPPDEILKREIRCGDSASFQGAERDVMLLSLVAAPTDGRRIMALTKDTFVQRYNVAASRAKDQMILYYSVPIDLLRNEHDMRYRLVEYCERVAGRRAVGFPGAVQQPLPEGRLVDPPFGSLFEQRVCNALLERGFVVVPQYESLGYRIDLVVVGANGKLAVECDGDHWHGPDRFGVDLARQRDLERCGWTFYRILESDFILNRDRALQPLLDLLKRRGILPGARQPQPFDAFDTDPLEGEAIEEGRSADAEAVLRDHGIRADSADDWPVVQDSHWVAQEPSPQGDSAQTFSSSTQDDPLRPSEAPEGGDTRWRTDASGAVRLMLPNYELANLRPLPKDFISLREIEDALAEVVAVEGPIVGSRLIRVVHRARGHKRLKRPSDAPYLQALQQLVNEGRLLREGDELESSAYRLPDTPSVRMRELGPRSLDEIPSRELAEVIHRCKTRHPRPDGDDGYVRAVLHTYRLVRMTDKVYKFITDIDRAYLVDD